MSELAFPLVPLHPGGTQGPLAGQVGNSALDLKVTFTQMSKKKTSCPSVVFSLEQKGCVEGEIKEIKPYLGRLSSCSALHDRKWVKPQLGPYSLLKGF